MSRYFAQIENGTVTRVIVANSIEWHPIGRVSEYQL